MGINDKKRETGKVSRAADAHFSADAYFTVEAALVVPVVLCIFVMILYLAFYLYDRCVISQDCYVLGYRQSIQKGTKDRVRDQEIRGQIGKKVFMLERLETDVSKGGTVRVRGNASMTPPLFGLDLFMRQRKWLLGVEEKARKTDPPKDYRRVRRLMNLAAAAGMTDP